MITPDSLRIRVPMAADIARITVLLGQLGYPVTEAFVAQQIDELAAGGADWIFVATLDEVPVGVACSHQFRFHHMPGRFSRLTVLVVDETYRRRGIGRALMAHVEACAREQGCVRMELNSAAHRREAHDFYRGLGYAEDAKRFVKPL